MGMPGYFDLIGMVVSRYDAETGEKLFPPGVQFDSPDKSFMAKFTGVPGKSMNRVLDIGKIVGKGQKVVDKAE